MRDTIIPPSKPISRRNTNKSLARIACLQVLEDVRSNPVHKLQAAKILARLDANLAAKRSGKRQKAGEISVLDRLAS